ncbi:DUF1501 domain-containing protein [Durusdinium trenchii]|uniref:DUF1501 domain-containing protein n=1 Tax=Durusdinium trenchii TaxID=1381693 RepID=A0ABP0LMQ4_9DINO
MSLGGAAGFAFDLARFNAFAADTSGYKALVCVFLFGGMDGHDTIIPFDTGSYNQYANIRSALFDRYADMEGGSTRARDRLLPMNLTNAGDFSGRQFAMPPELAPLHELFDRGDCAVVSNVGPLVVPMTRTEFQNRSAPRPPRLFSHNDQQSVWMASQPEGAQFGWGGRLADMALAANANSDATFTAVSVSGNSVFLSGEIAGQIEVGSNGPAEIVGIGDDAFYGSSSLPGLFEAQLRAENETIANLIKRDYVNVVDQSIDANRLLRESFASATPFATAFPQSRLGRQLQIVAQIIALRNVLGVSRQVFFVSTGGYDTHSNQANSIPNLHTGLAEAMRAFYDATEEIGAQNDVTSFTASDFGRTLTVNRDGTDHGWGGHHFVVGGAVQGNRMLGRFPGPSVGHDLDTGNGRLIPTTSVDQYAATLGAWFGLNSSELQMALPGLSNFSDTNIGIFS